MLASKYFIPNRTTKIQTIHFWIHLNLPAMWELGVIFHFKADRWIYEPCRLVFHDSYQFANIDNCSICYMYHKSNYTANMKS